jgi:hypothetical protein
MTGTLNRRRLLRTTVSGSLLVLALTLTLSVAPHAQARVGAAAAAPVTTTAISYRFDGVLTAGAHAGAALHGWLSGTQDSTGVLTATLTTDVLPRLSAGCAPHVDFGPACGLPPTANVGGRIVGAGPVATTALTAKGLGWTWVLAGSAGGATSTWAGTLLQGSANVGTWTLTPQTTTIHIDLGLKSDAKSKGKVSLTGAVDLGATAAGWAIGTYSPANGGLPSIVQGYVNAQKSSVEAALPLGSRGSVLITGWSRPGFNVLNWTGTFVGPAAGEHGTWLGQG